MGSTVVWFIGRAQSEQRGYRGSGGEGALHDFLVIVVSRFGPAEDGGHRCSGVDDSPGRQRVKCQVARAGRGPEPTSLLAKTTKNLYSPDDDATRGPARMSQRV